MKRHIIVFTFIFSLLSATFLAATSTGVQSVFRVKQLPAETFLSTMLSDFCFSRYGVFAILFAVSSILFWVGFIRTLIKKPEPVPAFTCTWAALLGLGYTVFVPLWLRYRFLHHTFYIELPIDTTNLTLGWPPYETQYFEARAAFYILILAFLTTALIRKLFFKRTIINMT